MTTNKITLEKWEGWQKCSDWMPDKIYDYELNNDPEHTYGFNADFLVCYHFGDEVPFMARCFLRNGKFIIAEYCHAKEDEGDGIGCPDSSQEEYWIKETIIITHWMHLYWPDGV